MSDDDDIEFDISRCICNHFPEDHDFDGCGKIDCPCDAKWV